MFKCSCVYWFGLSHVETLGSSSTTQCTPFPLTICLKMFTHCYVGGAGEKILVRGDPMAFPYQNSLSVETCVSSADHKPIITLSKVQDPQVLCSVFILFSISYSNHCQLNFTLARLPFSLTITCQ